MARACLESLCPPLQLWHRLRGFLHHMFCYIVCEKGKWGLGLGNRRGRYQAF